MNEDLDKISWAEYDKKHDKKKEPKTKGGFTKEKLLEIVQVADMTDMNMYIWVDCVKNYIKVYRNSMVDCIHKCIDVEKITVRKTAYKEVYFK